jgi:radical SAM protein with 4Fe4S-binding SPASM domain
VSLLNRNLLKLIKNIYIDKNEPISVVHFITNRCNARCSFCFIDFDNEDTFKGELSLDEISKLTKSYPKSLLNVNLTGGEPFARKDIQEIAELYIQNTSIQSIYITTNASLPDRIEKFANNIYKKYPHIEQTFQISIDDFPEKHNSVRKIKDLFDNCLKSFKVLKNLPEKVNPVVSITVSHENCENIEKIYDFFVDECGIDSIKCTIVRDEGVFETPKLKKQKILDAYSKLTKKINNDIVKGKIINYNSKSIQGRVHSKKDQISWQLVKKIYMDNKYISPCHAGSLFGIITSKGEVYPCEILEKKILGKLRDNNMDFSAIWKSKNTKNTREFIIKTKCSCSYECALSYNILGNYRYQPNLISAALGF